MLDTSGDELRASLRHGGIFLVKPSRGELEQLAEASLPGVEDVACVAAAIVRRGEAAHVAVTLGSDGAVLVNEGGATFIAAVPVDAVSAVGAGDSFLAGMTFGFASGLDATAAFRLGMAAGAAAVQSPGTELCRAADVERLLERVPEGQSVSV